MVETSADHLHGILEFEARRGERTLGSTCNLGKEAPDRRQATDRKKCRPSPSSIAEKNAGKTSRREICPS